MIINLITQVKQISSSKVAGDSDLKALYLSGNGIEVVSEDAFRGRPLTLVDLSGNNLDEDGLKRKSLEGLDRRTLRYLDLSGE